jgi:type I restriction enzyme S subunit
MSFSEEMGRLDDEWRLHRRRIDAVVSNPDFTIGAFLSGYKVAYYHARTHDEAFQMAYQKSMQEMMHLHHQVCQHAQGLAALHLHRDHSDPATWQAYPGDAAPFICDLEHLLGQLRVHAAALRPQVPKKHHAEMDEPFERFFNLAVPLLEALKQASAIAQQIQQLHEPGEPRPSGLKPGYKQTEVGVIPEEWETPTVADLVEQTAPICYGVVQVGQHTESGVPIVAIKFVKEIAHAPLHRTASYLEKPYARSRPKGGDVLISIKGTIGRVGIVPDGFQGNISRELARLRINPDFSPEYIAHQLEAGATQERIMRSVVGTTRLEFSIATLRKFQLPVPPALPEQRAIAEALSDVDGLLGGLDRLIAKKRDLKQAAMQQLLTGQTRLPGFHGDWEVKRLGEIAKIQRGASPRPIDSPVWFDDNSKVGWVRISDVTCAGMFLLETTQRLSPLGVKHSRPVATGSLIMSICATVGRPIITQIDVCIHDGFVVFDNLEADQRFLYYVLKWIEPDWSKHGQTGSQMNLNTGLINGTRIPLPPLAEQTAIAEVLSEMDGELAVLEQRREKTRALKQAMMQELLTGRTRLL